MKLAAALLAVAAVAARVEACCTSGGDANIEFAYQLHFDQSPPLTPEQGYAFNKCVNDFEAAKGAKDPGYPWINDTHTSSGETNILGCNADHCYGPSDCEGTNDDAHHDQSPRWTVLIGPRDSVKCPALQYFRVTGYTGMCGAPNPGRRRLFQTQAERNCADREQVLSEPLTQTAARLSSMLCENQGSDVGLTFAGAVLATLDADRDGFINCREWGVAKMRTTLAELGGHYFGPTKLPAPVCKLSKSGAAYLARYNAYLFKLTFGTLKANATGYAVMTAQRAAAAVEAVIVGNAAVSKLLDVKNAVVSKLNGTLPP